jgi:hypothetical protein
VDKLQGCSNVEAGWISTKDFSFCPGKKRFCRYSDGFVHVIENALKCEIFDRFADIKHVFAGMFTNLFRIKKIG